MFVRPKNSLSKEILASRAAKRSSRHTRALVMKIIDLLLGRSVRFVEGKSDPDTPASLFDMAKGLEARYKFLEIPKTVGEYEFEKGVTFAGGEFDGKRAITKFQIFSNGLLSESNEGTEVCDKFFDDVISWVNKEFGYDFSEQENLGRVYQNEIAFESIIPLDNLFKPIAFITQKVPELLLEYGQQNHVYEFTGLFCNVDSTKAAQPIPTQFALERRVGYSHDENLYYSRAPLRTRDHIEVLEILEREMSA